jgi:LCP family protein required for cell wall assembly
MFVEGQLIWRIIMSHQDPGKENVVAEKLSLLLNKFKTLKRPHQIIAIILILLIPAAAYSTLYYYRISKPAGLFAQSPDFNKELEVEWDVNDYFNRNIVNIALLGFDRSEARDERYSVYRTDTIKVISVNLDEDKISIIDIPRDIHTRIADTSTHDKINHAYYFGWQYGGGDDDDRHLKGLDYTLKSISNVLGGIPITYYVAVDMDAVVTLVDEIGGVRFGVPFDVYNTRGRLVVEEGEHLLTGYQYLWYLRTRSRGGDIGRVQRQTDLLFATLDHIRSKGLVKNLPVLYNSYHELIDTNLSTQQIISLAMYASDFSSKDMVQYTLTGRGQSSDGIYYMVMDQDVRAKIIRTVFGIDFEPPPTQRLTDTTPKLPGSFTAQLVEGDKNKSIRLSWEPGDRHNREYNIYRKNGDVEVQISEKQTAASYYDTDIQPGNTYQYRLVAVNYRAVSTSVSTSITIEAIEYFDNGSDKKNQDEQETDEEVKDTRPVDGPDNGSAEEKDGDNEDGDAEDVTGDKDI